MLVVPILASSSALSLPQCPTCAAIYLIWTVLCFANSSSASWQWITVLLLVGLDESACRVERLSVQMTMVLLCPNDNGLTTVVLECGRDFSYGCDFRLEY